jgi:hypothetical protein
MTHIFKNNNHSFDSSESNPTNSQWQWQQQRTVAAASSSANNHWSAQSIKSRNLNVT